MVLTYPDPAVIKSQNPLDFRMTTVSEIAVGEYVNYSAVIVCTGNRHPI